MGSVREMRHLVQYKVQNTRTIQVTGAMLVGLRESQGNLIVQGIELALVFKLVTPPLVFLVGPVPPVG